jgi:hypothetical protein
MRLALNLAKMAKGGFSHAAVQETQYLIKKPRAEVREEKKRGVVFPGHNKVKAAIARHPAMLRQNQTPRCHPCQNGTAKNPQTSWRRKGTGAPPPNRHRQQNPEPTTEPTPPLPGTPLGTTGNTSGDQSIEIINLLAGYTYSHTSLPCAESFTLDASAQESEHDTDFDPDMPPDEGTSTG